MNKKLYNFVWNHGENITSLVGLHDFQLNQTSSIDLPKNDPRRKDFEKKFYSAATMVTDHEYLRGSLVYNEPLFSEYFRSKSYGTILSILCHEIAHVITSEPFENLLIESAKKDEDYYSERLTERVGRIIHCYYSEWMQRNKVDIKTGKKKK